MLWNSVPATVIFLTGNQSFLKINRTFFFIAQILTDITIYLCAPTYWPLHSHILLLNCIKFGNESIIYCITDTISVSVSSFHSILFQNLPNYSGWSYFWKLVSRSGVNWNFQGPGWSVKKWNFSARYAKNWDKKFSKPIKEKNGVIIKWTWNSRGF